MSKTDDDLLARIAASRSDAAQRVIFGGMRENLHMAQVMAAEAVVIASLDATLLRLEKEKPSPDRSGEGSKGPDS